MALVTGPMGVPDPSLDPTIPDGTPLVCPPKDFQGWINEVHQLIFDHEQRTDNPHQVPVSSGGLPTTTSVAAAGPVVVSNSGLLSAGVTISMPAASDTVDGYLSAADWSNFDSKVDGEIVNTQVGFGDANDELTSDATMRFVNTGLLLTGASPSSPGPVGTSQQWGFNVQMTGANGLGIGLNLNDNGSNTNILIGNGINLPRGTISTLIGSGYTLPPGNLVTCVGLGRNIEFTNLGAAVVSNVSVGIDLVSGGNGGDVNIGLGNTVGAGVAIGRGVAAGSNCVVARIGDATGSSIALLGNASAGSTGSAVVGNNASAGSQTSVIGSLSAAVGSQHAICGYNNRIDGTARSGIWGALGNNSGISDCFLIGVQTVAQRAGLHIGSTGRSLNVLSLGEGYERIAAGAITSNGGFAEVRGTQAGPFADQGGRSLRIAGGLARGVGTPGRVVLAVGSRVGAISGTTLQTEIDKVTTTEDGILVANATTFAPLPTPGGGVRLEVVNDELWAANSAGRTQLL